MLPSDLPNDNAPNPASGSPTEPAPPAAAAQPQYVTQEQFMQGINAIAEAIKAGHANVPTEPAQPSYDDPSMEQITQDLQNGDVKSLTKLLENHEKKIVDRVVRPMEQKGYTTLAQQARRLAESDPTMPYFKELSKTIDDLMKPCTLEQRADPIAYQTAYNIALGMNHQTLIKREVEAAIRKATEAGDGGTTPTGTKAIKYPDGTPSVKDLLGADAEAQIAANNWTPYDYARNIYRVNSWPEAAAKIKAYHESVAGGNA
jgi:hypothetical protein